MTTQSNPSIEIPVNRPHAPGGQGGSGGSSGQGGPRRHLKAWGILGILAALGLWLVPYWRSRHPPAEKPAAGAEKTAQKGERKPSVRVLDLKPRPFSVVLEGLGTVTPLATVTVKPQVDGPLMSVAYREGRNVRRGELLAEIDPRPFRIRWAQAKATVARDRAQLKNAQLDLSRYQNLVSQKLIAQQQLDAQQSQVDQLTATVEADQANAADAELQLQYTRILSPIDGVTGIRLVDPGNLVHASDATGIVVLTQLDPIAVVFTLPQDDLPRLSLAMTDGKPKVIAASRAGDQVIAEGVLTVIDNQINTQTASVRLKAEFKNADRKLWPNLFVRARIEVSRQNDALLVPAAAVQHGPNGSFVYTLTQDNVAHMQPVEIALLQGEDALIGNGLHAGDRVVVDGQNQIKPNSVVTPRVDGAQAGAGKIRRADGSGAGTGSGKPEGTGTESQGNK
jgi:multidrug efflux system membrane fusion protein